MEKMIVTIFNTEAAAYDGVSALKALNDGGDITLYATAVLAKDADGKVSVKQTSGVGRRCAGYCDGHAHWCADWPAGWPRRSRNRRIAWRSHRHVG